MPRYRVLLPRLIWFNVEIDAEDEEYAEEAARALAPTNVLCAQDAGWNHDWSIDESDEWGDMPASDTEIIEIIDNDLNNL